MTFPTQFSLETIDEHWAEYYPKVYGYFFRRVDNRTDVEDLTSITLTEFFNHVLDNPQITNPHGYLWRVAYHTLVNFVRRKSKRPTTVPLEPEQIMEVIPDNLETELEAKTLSQKFDQILLDAKTELSPEEYKLFSAVYLDGEAVKTVAKRHHLKPNTLSVKLRRILAKLKIILATYDS